MPLSQEDRIAISLKIINIPVENASSEQIQAQIGEAQQVAEKKDNGHKTIQNDIEVFLNKYQNELELIDGKERAELTEQNLIDSATRVIGNFLFPNQPDVPTPTLADGVWKGFPPYSNNIALGKNYQETYPTIQKEQDVIDAVNAIIATVEGEPDPNRSTGLECGEDTSGTCSDPMYVDQETCELNGETWTASGGPDTYSPDASVQQALTDLVTEVNNWKTFIQNEQNQIVTNDSDTAKQVENDAAIADIDNAISVIDGWLAYDDFDTTTTLPSGSGGSACAAYDALTPDDFIASKLRTYELQEIKDEITARESFLVTRQAQVETNLGTVTQDYVSGEITGGSGLYLDRFRLIDQRLNIMNGSLSQKLGADQGIAAQEKKKQSNAIGQAAYLSVLFASKFRAPASNTGTIHLLDASGFQAGDTVYIVADKQGELTGTVDSVDGNTVFIDTEVPEKYNHNNFARMYKVL